MPGFGISVEDWVKEEIEKPLAYGDDRSARVNRLIRVGLAAENAAKQYGSWPDDIEDQEDLVHEAIKEYCDA